MSDSQPVPVSASEIEADVRKALAQYDGAHAPAALQAAADALVREDGAAPADPTQGLAFGRMQLRLWMDVLSRFRRDIPDDFDPNHPPPATIAPPEINGEQMLPGTKPSSIKDPVIRAKYEAMIAENDERVRNFAARVRLSAIRGSVGERAAESLRNARDVLGVPAAEIQAAVKAAALAGAERKALENVATP